MRPFPFIYRLVALITLVAFTATSVQAAPASSTPVASTPVENFSPIPEALGKAEEPIQGSNGKMIFYIQDAHDSLEAQEHIAKLIHYFVAHRGVSTVFEEGYEGPVPTDRFFGFIKDAKIREKVSYFLMDHLRLGAAEYAHINRKQDFKLIGADNIQLHLKNIAAYHKTAKHQKEIESDLTALHQEIKALAHRYFSQALTSWISLREKLDQNQLGLMEYVKRLTALAPDAKRSATIQILLAAESSQDPKVLDQVKRLDPKTLFEEIDQFENGFAHSFLKNPRDFKIFEYHKDLSLLQRLNRLEITPEEYSLVSKVLARTKTEEAADFILKHSGKSFVVSKRWEREIKEAMSFYEIAQQRDAAIEARLKEFSDDPSQKNAVIVFGGFHKHAIEKLLRNFGYSYQIILPKISGLKDRHQKLYRHLMSSGYQPFRAPASVVQASRYASVLDDAVIKNPAFLEQNLSELASRFDSSAKSARPETRGINQEPSYKKPQAQPLDFSAGTDPLLAVRQWLQTQNDLAPDDVFYQLAQEFEKRLARLAAKKQAGIIHPEVDLRVHSGEAAKNITPGSRRLRIGTLGITGNPIHWGHILAALTAQDELNLDRILIPVQGGIGYKQVPADSLVPQEARHDLAKQVFAPFAPFLSYSDVLLGNDKIGEEAIQMIRQMNADQNIDWFFIAGGENPERIKMIMQDLEQFSVSYGVRQNPQDSLTWAILARGDNPLYGKGLDQNKIDALAEETGFHLPAMVIPISNVLHEVSSRNYRESRDTRLVPPPVHAFAQSQGYYGFPRKEARAELRRNIIYFMGLGVLTAVFAFDYLFLNFSLKTSLLIGLADAALYLTAMILWDQLSAPRRPVSSQPYYSDTPVLEIDYREREKAFSFHAPPKEDWHDQWLSLLGKGLQRNEIPLRNIVLLRVNGHLVYRDEKGGTTMKKIREQANLDPPAVPTIEEDGKISVQFTVVYTVGTQQTPRAELREQIQIQSRGFGEYAVRAGNEHPSPAERDVYVAPENPVSFYFNIHTDTPLKNPQDWILARVYYEKAQNQWEHDLPMSLYDNFGNGVYRFGVTLPKNFSGRLTFQYSLDGGKTWPYWANNGPADNYEIHRFTSLQVQVRDILANEKTAPDPTVLLDLIRAGISDADIYTAAKAVPSLRAHDYLTHPNTKPLLHEIQSARPYLYDLSEKLLQESGDHRLLFLDRDARLMYLAMFVILMKYWEENRVREKAIPAPGSQDFWSNFPRQLTQLQEKKFFAVFGITPEAIRAGNIFYLVDTGFLGSIGLKIRSLLADSHYFSDDSPAKEDAFPVRLVLSHREDSNVLNISKIDPNLAAKKLSLAEMVKLFPQTLRRHQSDSLDHTLVVFMQNFPRYHSSLYSVEEIQGKLTAIGYQPRMDYMEADSTYTGINASVVNPAAALIGEIALIRGMLQDLDRDQGLVQRFSFLISDKKPNPAERAELRTTSQSSGVKTQNFLRNRAEARMEDSGLKEKLVFLEKTLEALQREAGFDPDEAVKTYRGENFLGVYSPSDVFITAKIFRLLGLGKTDRVLSLGSGLLNDALVANLFNPKEILAVEGDQEIYQKSLFVKKAFYDLASETGIKAGSSRKIKIRHQDFSQGILQSPDELSKFTVIYYYALGTKKEAAISRLLAKNMGPETIVIVLDPLKTVNFPSLTEITRDLISIKAEMKALPYRIFMKGGHLRRNEARGTKKQREEFQESLDTLGRLDPLNNNFDELRKDALASIQRLVLVQKIGLDNSSEEIRLRQADQMLSLLAHPDSGIRQSISHRIGQIDNFPLEKLMESLLRPRVHDFYRSLMVPNSKTGDTSKYKTPYGVFSTRLAALFALKVGVDHDLYLGREPRWKTFVQQQSLQSKNPIEAPEGNPHTLLSSEAPLTLPQILGAALPLKDDLRYAKDAALVLLPYLQLPDQTAPASGRPEARVDTLAKLRALPEGTVVELPPINSVTPPVRLKRVTINPREGYLLYGIEEDRDKSRIENYSFEINGSPDSRIFFINDFETLEIVLVNIDDKALGHNRGIGSAIYSWLAQIAQNENLKIGNFGSVAPKQLAAVLKAMESLTEISTEYGASYPLNPAIHQPDIEKLLNFLSDKKILVFFRLADTGKHIRAEFLREEPETKASAGWEDVKTVRDAAGTLRIVETSNPLLPLGTRLTIQEKGNVVFTTPEGQEIPARFDGFTERLSLTGTPKKRSELRSAGPLEQSEENPKEEPLKLEGSMEISFDQKKNRLNIPKEWQSAIVSASPDDIAYLVLKRKMVGGKTVLGFIEVYFSDAALLETHAAQLGEMSGNKDKMRGLKRLLYSSTQTVKLSIERKEAAPDVVSKIMAVRLDVPKRAWTHFDKTALPPKRVTLEGRGNHFIIIPAGKARLATEQEIKDHKTGNPSRQELRTAKVMINGKSRWFESPLVPEDNQSLRALTEQLQQNPDGTQARQSLRTLGQLDPGFVVRHLLWKIAEPKTGETFVSLILEIAQKSPKQTGDALVGAFSNPQQTEAAKKILLSLAKTHARYVAAPMVMALFDDRTDASRLESLIYELSDIDSKEIPRPLVGALQNPDHRTKAAEILSILAQKNTREVLGPLVQGLFNEERRDPARALVLQIAKRHPQMATDFLSKALFTHPWEPFLEATLLEVVAHHPNKTIPILTQWLNSSHREQAKELLVKTAKDSRKALIHQLDKARTPHLLPEIRDIYLQIGHRDSSFAKRQEMRSKNNYATLSFRETKHLAGEIQNYLDLIAEEFKTKPWLFYNAGPRGSALSAQIKSLMGDMVGMLGHKKNLLWHNHPFTSTEAANLRAAARNLLVFTRVLNGLRKNRLALLGNPNPLEYGEGFQRQYAFSMGQQTYQVTVITRWKEAPEHQARIAINLFDPEAPKSRKKYNGMIDSLRLDLDYRNGRHRIQFDLPNSFRFFTVPRDYHYTITSFPELADFSDFVRAVDKKLTKNKTPRKELRAFPVFDWQLRKQILEKTGGVFYYPAAGFDDEFLERLTETKNVHALILNALGDYQKLSRERKIQWLTDDLKMTVIKDQALSESIHVFEVLYQNRPLTLYVVDADAKIVDYKTILSKKEQESGIQYLYISPLTGNRGELARQPEFYANQISQLKTGAILEVSNGARLPLTSQEGNPLEIGLELLGKHRGAAYYRKVSHRDRETLLHYFQEKWIHLTAFRVDSSPRQELRASQLTTAEKIEALHAKHKELLADVTQHREVSQGDAVEGLIRTPVGLYVYTKAYDAASNTSNLIKKLQAKSKTENFLVVDYGHGMGEVLIELLLRNPSLNLAGVEGDPELFQKSLLLVEWAVKNLGIDRKRIHLFEGDFNTPKFKPLMQKADVHFYNVSGANEETAFGKNLSESVKPGASVLLYGDGDYEFPALNTKAFVKRGVRQRYIVLYIRQELRATSRQHDVLVKRMNALVQLLEPTKIVSRNHRTLHDRLKGALETIKSKNYSEAAKLLRGISEIPVYSFILLLGVDPQIPLRGLSLSVERASLPEPFSQWVQDQYRGRKTQDSFDEILQRTYGVNFETVVEEIMDLHDRGSLPRELKWVPGMNYRFQRLIEAAARRDVLKPYLFHELQLTSPWPRIEELPNRDRTGPGMLANLLHHFALRVRPEMRTTETPDQEARDKIPGAFANFQKEKDFSRENQHSDFPMALPWKDAERHVESGIKKVVADLNQIPFLYTSSWSHSGLPSDHYTEEDRTGELDGLYYQHGQTPPKDFLEAVSGHTGKFTTEAHAGFISFRANENDPDFQRFKKALTAIDGVRISDSLHKHPFGKERLIVIPVPKTLITPDKEKGYEAYLVEKWARVLQAAKTFLPGAIPVQPAKQRLAAIDQGLERSADMPATVFVPYEELKGARNELRENLFALGYETKSHKATRLVVYGANLADETLKSLRDAGIQTISGELTEAWNRFGQKENPKRNVLVSLQAERLKKDWDRGVLAFLAHRPGDLYGALLFVRSEARLFGVQEKNGFYSIVNQALDAAILRHRNDLVIRMAA